MSSEGKDGGAMMEEKRAMREKSKLGHRRISDQGTVTYKKKTISEIQKALQLGIRISVTLAHNKSKRDMLLKDFGTVETLSFPRTGGKDTPTHDLSDFTFKTFAPIAFRYFRDFFHVDIDDYLNSICHQELRELSNAGASGSIFYITCDDEFIIKTVQHKEASFLQKLLPEYYINLIQHPRTLLPKFYGLYCYQTMGKNIRFVIMNNLLPSIKIHEKYDLKGSTYKRMASPLEKGKSSPTLKDLDFRENHNDGLYLEIETYEALLNTIQRDCRVLESFSIMDYSLLLGIHNLDQSLRQKKEQEAEFENKINTVSDNHAMKDMSVYEETNEQTETVLNVDKNESSKKDVELSNLTQKLEDNSSPIKNTDSTDTDKYFTPVYTEGPVEDPQSKINDSDNSVTKFRMIPKPVITNFYKPPDESEITLANSRKRKKSFFSTISPIGHQLTNFIKSKPLIIWKTLENSVERVIQNTWLECDKDLYSYLPPLAILSSGSTDPSVFDSDEDITSIETDVFFSPPVMGKNVNRNCHASIRGQNNQSNASDVSASPNQTNSENAKNIVRSKEPFNRQKSRSKSTRRIAAYSTVLESIHAPVEVVGLQANDEEFIPSGGIPARNKLGDRLILFMGIIDILQSYRILKKMEHNMKALFLDAGTISVTNPTFYAQRFQEFFGNFVFKKIPSLDQPQILGNHARRFRNYVHMGLTVNDTTMRQNPDKKRTSIRKEIIDQEKPSKCQELPADADRLTETAVVTVVVAGDHHRDTNHEPILSPSTAADCNKTPLPSVNVKSSSVQ